MISHHRDPIDWLRTAGAQDVRIETGGKHPRLVFLWCGRERSSPISQSPSDSLHSTQNQITALRHMLGLVAGERRIGARRHRRRRIVRAQLPLTSTPIVFGPDIRQQLLAHPASVRTIAARFDAAWLAWWRQIMREIGAQSRL